MAYDIAMARRVPIVPRPRALLLPLLAVTLTACSGAAGSPAPAARARELPVVDLPYLEERALLLYLADRRLYEEFTVQESLTGPPELRRHLAVALGRIGDPRGRRVLEGLLVDEAPAVRRAAAFALGELAEAAAAPALLAAAAGADRETAVLAVEALGKLGTPLVEVLARLTPLAEEERWARLLPHLYRFESGTVVPLATRGLELEEPGLRSRAAYALSREPRPEALPVLRRLAAEPDPRLRAWAARALGRVGEGADLELLAPLLGDGEAGPVIQSLRAAHALLVAGKAAPPDAWRPTLLALLDDPRPGVRATALEVAGAWLLDETLGAALVERFRTGPEGERELALKALAEGEHPRTPELAAEAAVAPAPGRRAAAAEALGRIAPSLPAPAARWLTELAADPVPAVRVAVLAVRLELAPEAAPEILPEALADPDPAVRAAAFDWLDEHPVLPFEAIQAALAGRGGDRLVTTRLSALAALAARGEAEPLERGAVVALLESLATDREYLVRRQAIAGLERLGRPAPPLGAVEESRRVETYRQIVQQTARARTVEIHTLRGTLTVRLACPEAPLTCLSFLQLAGQGFYDGLPFHRLVPGFVVQGGDPRGDGWGGPGYTLRDEINRLRFDRGVLGMARSGPDTAGSQFFLTLAPQPHLDGGYTAFGWVVAGGEVLDRIVQGDVIESIVVRNVPGTP